MLSHKWTFSLTSLVVLLALIFVGPSAMAAEFSTTLSVDDSMDVSFADGVQVEYNASGGSDTVTINVSFGKVVNHDVALAADGDASPDFADNDFQIIAYNKFGGTETPPVIADDDTNPGSPTPATPADGKNFTIDLAKPDIDSPIVKVLVLIPKHVVEVADPRADLNDDGTRKVEGKNAAAELTIHIVSDNVGPPTVHFMKRPGEFSLPVTTETFDVIVQLSEEAKQDTFTKDRFSITDNAAITKITHLGGFAGTTEFVTTGRDIMVHKYLLEVTPTYKNMDDIVIKIKEFETQEKSAGGKKYTPPATDAARTEGVNMLTVKVGKEAPPVKTAGIEVKLLNEGIIPKDGYLVVVKDGGGSAVRNPGDAKKAPAATARQPFGLTYNRVDGGGMPNLETLLSNGGTIDIVAPQALVISEIMWGSDASIADSFKSQYIELRNVSGAEIKMGDGTHKLMFYGAGAVLPDMSVAANNIQDRAGTVGAGGFWLITGKGQSGRSGVGEAPGDVVAVTPTQALISMQRSIDATGKAADGTLASSWAASVPPGVNFEAGVEGVRIGSPGRAPVAYPVAPTPAPTPVTVPVAMPADIMITEIMVDTGDGRLPQWIELTNVSGSEKSLAGWSLMIANSEADADVIGETVSISLSGTLGVGGGEDAGGTMGKSLLLVGGTARSSSNIAGSDRVINVSDQVGETGRYQLISDMAFMLALLPPQKTGVLTYGDTAGNLGADEAWEIPMSENGRSSLIRREMLSDGMATMGTSANGWVLASSTSLVSGPATWYGSDEDAGTPGYDAGGPLPVELSHFRPVRDKATGAVVITWSTQSELNNAGFFIKRSQQRDGEFVVINPTMIAGAGTTSEKQFYTYTDTTAQPNVVYYYQIEDVSLDGNRQTLTSGIRLKGHVGATGKATMMWGDLKTQE